MPTINPVMLYDIISQSMFPQAYVGEVFILRRDGVSFELKSSTYGKLKGSGNFTLTNMRLVFNCTSNASSSNFLACQIDLSEITNPTFEQPIFGSNYLIASCRADGETFKMKFNKGGCGTFLRVLYDLLSSVPRTTFLVQGRAVPAAAQYAPSNVGYVDPSDISVIYIQQPVAAQTQVVTTQQETRALHPDCASAPPL